MPLRVDQVRELYTSGLSTRQIAAQLGYAKSYIHKVCQDISRTQSEAAILRQIPTSKHWRSSRNAARTKMERRLGRKLLRTEHVHHIDGDFTNNADENLQVLNGREHNREHTIQRLANGWKPRAFGPRSELAKQNMREGIRKAREAKHAS